MNVKASRLVLLLGLIILCNVNIYAQCDSINADINGKIRYLGAWTANGKPQYLMPPDTISDELIEVIKNALPEGTNITGTSFFDPNVKPNTELKDSAEIYLTLVQEVASWKNSLGFYTYDVDNPPSSYEDIDSLTLIFPNIDAPNIIKPGDKVYLGTFKEGTGIGYFLIGNGWTGDTVCLREHIIFTDKNLNSYIQDTNSRQKTVLLYFNEMLILGIEDKVTNPDNDFNDAVFRITTNNFDAIDTVDIPKIPVAEILGDTILCSDDALADITINIFGTPPFDIVYNDGTQDVLVENIVSNTYTFQTSVRDTLTLVSVKNGGGFGVVKGMAIVKQSSLTAYFTSGEIDICEGAEDVPVEITLEGHAPYSIIYKENDTEHTIDSIAGNTVEILVSFGKTYMLTKVTDLYCEVELEDSLSLNTVDAPTASVENMDSVLCEGGSVDISFSFEGISPFTFIYKVNGVNDTISTTETNYTLSVAEDAEVIPVKIIDGQCASLQVSGLAKVTFLDLPTFDLAAPSVGCGVDEAIEITLSFTGQSPFNYTYEIDGEVEEATSAANSVKIVLQPDERFELLSFSDAVCDGDVDKNEAVFHHYPIPSAKITTETSAICDGASAAIEIEFKGKGPWTTVISDGVVNDTIVSMSTSYTYFTSTIGTYELLTVWNDECDNGEVSGQASVIVSDVPSMTVDATNNSICGESPAIIILSFTGESPWTFDVKHGVSVTNYTSESASFELEVSAAGDYEIANLTDAFCTSSDAWAFDVEENQSPTATLTGNGAICFGEAATLTVNLTGTAPFEFTYTDGTEEHTVNTSDDEYIISATITGTYLITKINDANCTGTASGEVVVDNSLSPTVAFTGDNILCEGGEARLSMEFSGTAPFNFTLKNGVTETDYTFEASELEVFVAEPGTYEIINFSDANCAGISAQAVVITLSETPTAAISLDGNGELCGDEKATIVINTTGTAPFSIVYSDGKEEYTIITDETEYSFETSASGLYTVISVSDANCTGTASGEAEVINFSDELIGEITGEDQVCEESEIFLNFSGSSDIMAFTWSTTGEGVLTAISVNEASYTPAEGESGTITFSLEVANACGSNTFTQDIAIFPPPIATFSMFPEDLLTDTEITFTADEGGYDNYEWDFGDGNTGSGNPVNHSYSTPGEYLVTLIVENKGCFGEGSGSAPVKTKNDLYVPNVFNPNALNSENQVVKVYGTNVSEDSFSFKIVNRWGHVMYQTNSFFTANSLGWDGKEFNNSEMQSLSAFTYILRGKFRDGETFERTGTITILQ